MSNFPLFAEMIENHFCEMSKHELYKVATQDLVQPYLKAFKSQDNPIYKTNTYHDCSCCKQFIRNIGNLINIIDGKVISVWDVKNLPEPYNEVAKQLSEIVHASRIQSVYRTKENKFGTKSNSILLEDDTTHTFYHFYCQITDKHHSISPGEEIGAYHSKYQVFKRGLDELTENSILTIKDLIDANNLYRGREFKQNIDNFLKLKQRYSTLDNTKEKKLFVWENLNKYHGLIRNTVIGSLAIDLSSGVPLEDAVRMFESKTAPINYKRPKALITASMVNNAMDTLKDLGLENSINRRVTKFNDISVNNVLFVDNSVSPLMQDSLTNLLMQEVKPKTVNLDNTVEISIDDFLKNVLPNSTSLQAYVENKHLGNFVTLTSPKDVNDPLLFKWNNNFAWSYKGNVTDSVKQRVKAAGGNIDSDFRVSLSWFNTDDLDLHCKDPLNNHIYFGNKQDVLDVDMNASNVVTDPVENMSFSQLQDGTYRFFVNQYNKRNSINVGYEIEVEFKGKTYNYNSETSPYTKDDVIVIELKDGELVSITPTKNITATLSSKDNWNVKTESLVNINTIVLSPNHWDEQNIGNKHWFFILKDCVNPEPCRGIYNEFLKSELDPHRKVFEILGDKTKCTSDPEGLSGIGFSDTKKETLTVVVDSAIKYKIQF